MPTATGLPAYRTAKNNRLQNTEKRLRISILRCENCLYGALNRNPLLVRACIKPVTVWIISLILYMVCIRPAVDAVAYAGIFQISSARACRAAFIG
jgi:hypothetical protein